MDRSILLKYLSGDATREEKEIVTIWLDEKPENMKEFMALRKLYDMAIWQDSAKEYQEASGKIRKRQISPRKIVSEIIKIAAIFIIGFLVFKVLYPEIKIPASLIQTLYVPAGQRAEIVLADGSKVWLNSNTTLIFPTAFKANSREVTLHGEAYFDVAHDVAKPFKVKTDDFDVKVYGTEFNVRAYSGSKDFEVALIRGSVEVTKQNEENGVLLKPDQRLFIQDNRLVASPITHTNYYLWKDGIISFDDESFPDIVRKLELYFDLRIDVKNDQIMQYRCTGKFRSKDGVEHILKVLQLRNKFTYTIDDKLNIITIK
jgi:transmembrane sensor